MVAVDVRARALQALGDLPRGAAERTTRRLPRVLALRHGLAPHERRRGARAAARGDRQQAHDPSVRHSRPAARAVHARGEAVERGRHFPVRAIRLPRGRAPARLLPRQPRGRPDHVADGSGGAGRRNRLTPAKPASGVILGIETSCDDTCAALVTRDGTILANVIASQGLLHERYGGVVPEIASRQHLEVLDSVVDDALERAGATLADVDEVAVTRGPGLIGALLVGVSAAKALAASRRLPLAPVDHLHGHVTAP